MPPIRSSASGRGRYLTASLEEIASSGDHSAEDVAAALREVQRLDPAGVGARDVREWPAAPDREPQRPRRSSLADRRRPPQAGRIEASTASWRACWPAARAHPDREHVIHHLNPRPGLKYSGQGARQVEPDVHIFKTATSTSSSSTTRTSRSAPERQLPPHARPQPRAEQGGPQLRQGALRVGAPAHEEHRTAQADHSARVPVPSCGARRTFSTAASTSSNR